MVCRRATLVPPFSASLALCRFHPEVSRSLSSFPEPGSAIWPVLANKTSTKTWRWLAHWSVLSLTNGNRKAATGTSLVALRMRNPRGGSQPAVKSQLRPSLTVLPQWNQLRPKVPLRQCTEQRETANVYCVEHLKHAWALLWNKSDPKVTKLILRVIPKMYESASLWLFVTPWTVAYQAPLFMGFSMPEHWDG